MQFKIEGPLMSETGGSHYMLHIPENAVIAYNPYILRVMLSCVPCKVYAFHVYLWYATYVHTYISLSYSIPCADAGVRLEAASGECVGQALHAPTELHCLSAVL